MKGRIRGGGVCERRPAIEPDITLGAYVLPCPVLYWDCMVGAPFCDMVKDGGGLKLKKNKSSNLVYINLLRPSRLSADIFWSWVHMNFQGPKQILEGPFIYSPFVGGALGPRVRAANWSGAQSSGHPGAIGLYENASNLQ